MIEFVKGNFFDYDADIRVNTVNCVGVMGAGAALQFKNKFPKMFDDYVRECKLGKIQIGTPHVWIDQDFFNVSPIIINFPTKNHWRNPSQYEYIEKGLEWLRNYLIQNPGKTITLPALGCGHGGLEWSRVKLMIIDYLDLVNNKILVFEPESSIVSDMSSNEINELKEHNIVKISPNDPNYPENLTGKVAFDIYFKGNIALLNQPLFSIVVNSKATDRERGAILGCIDAMSTNSDFVCLMSYSSSFEIDLIKKIAEKNIKLIVLVPYGILNIKIRKDIQAIWDSNNMSIASISKPKQSWSVGESIKVLKFRLKSSNVVLITNQDLQFFSKIEKEFLESQSTFFYLNYWNEKLAFFEKIHAKQIGRDKVSHMPNMAPVNEYLQF